MEAVSADTASTAGQVAVRSFVGSTLGKAALQRSEAVQASEADGRPAAGPVARPLRVQTAVSLGVVDNMLREDWGGLPSGTRVYARGNLPAGLAQQGSCPRVRCPGSLPRTPHDPGHALGKEITLPPRGRRGKEAHPSAQTQTEVGPFLSTGRERGCGQRSGQAEIGE